MALRVLLADESTTIKKVMQLALQDFAVEVKSVHSGVDVVEVARTFQPDIVFADVLLQKKNGYEVSGDLKRDPELSQLPVVLMWSSFMELDEKLAQISNADRRLEKPFDVESLRQLVLELVPKTRSQRLAHFLKFPDSFTEPLQSEEKSRAMAEEQRRRVQEAAPPSSKQQFVPDSEATQRVDLSALEQQEAEEMRHEEPPAPAPIPAPPAPAPRMAPARAPAAAPIAQPAKAAPPPMAAPKPAGAPRATMMPAKAPPGRAPAQPLKVPSGPPPLQTAEEPVPQSPPRVPDGPPTGSGEPVKPSNWNMETFDDISSYEEPAPLESVPAYAPDADDDDEVFSEMRLNHAKPAAPFEGSNEPTHAAPMPSAKRAPDERDPWSHQDLNRFKIDASEEQNEFGVEVEMPEHDQSEDQSEDHAHESGSSPGWRDTRSSRPDAPVYHADDHTMVMPRGTPRPAPVEIEMPDADLEVEAHDQHHQAEEVNIQEHGDHGLELEHPQPASLSLTTMDDDENEDDAWQSNFEESLARAEPGGAKRPAQAPAAAAAPQQGPQIPRMTPEELESIIRAQSHDMIEAVVRKIVPDLATTIIREELHRLLAEEGSAAGLSSPQRPSPSRKRETPR